MMSQHCYKDGNYNPLNNPDADEIIKDLSSSYIKWSNLVYYNDGGPGICFPEPGGAGKPVMAGSFTNSIANKADFLWFSGHGTKDPTGTNPQGYLILDDYVFSSANLCNETLFSGSSGYQGDCFWSTDSNLPYVYPNLKWVFTVASWSAILNQYYWGPAFNLNQPGLHGWYGWSDEPVDDVGQQFADRFANYAVQQSSQPDPLSIHDSWVHAAQDAGEGNAYGIFELQDADTDQLSGTPSGVSVPVFSSGVWSGTNPLSYYTPTSAVSINPSISQLNSISPGAYQPYYLIPESWTDSYLASEANKYEPGSVEYYPNANQYQILSTSYTGSHYEASGAVLGAGHISTIPFNFTQQSAQSYAIAQIDQYGGGLPSDAVLHETIIHYEIANGTKVIIGYNFIWKHSNGLAGGDRIEVGVDNYSKPVCSSIGPCGCNRYQTQYFERINYFYRLWRSLGSPVPTGSPSPAAALSSQAAFTLASSQIRLKGNKGSLGSLLGYAYVYWSPQFDSTTNIAYPAYAYYYSNGSVFYVDARAGTLLGETKEL